MVPIEKPEQYREMSPYWAKRLTYQKDGKLHFKNFDTVTFSNGYATDRPQKVIKCLGIKIDTGKVKWGAVKGEKYFVLKLGEQL